VREQEAAVQEIRRPDRKRDNRHVMQPKLNALRGPRLGERYESLGAVKPYGLSAARNLSEEARACARSTAQVDREPNAFRRRRLVQQRPAGLSEDRVHDFETTGGEVRIPKQIAHLESSRAGSGEAYLKRAPITKLT